MWRCSVFTLFPDWFDWMNESRPVRNAIQGGELELVLHDYRQHTPLNAGQVDDTPYGGGAGMLLRVDVVAAALEAAYAKTIDEIRSESRIVLMSPAGRTFTDKVAQEWARDATPTIILSGRYEGFDWRVHEHIATEEVSVGPYVLSGGEIAAMAIIDATTRYLPGALGNKESLGDETFSDNMAGGSEYPHYTRPAEFRGWTVPEVLLGGHHAKIDEWRKQQAERRTPN